MRKTSSRGSPALDAARTISRSSSWTTSNRPSANSPCSVRAVMRLTDPLTYRQPPSPKTMTRSVDELTRLRKCAVCRWAVRMSAQPSNSDSKKAADPEDDLQVDQAADIAVVGVRDRPGGVQRHVRRERRKDSQP